MITNNMITMVGFGFLFNFIEGEKKKKDKEKTLTFLPVNPTNLLNNNLFKLSGIFLHGNYKYEFPM